MDSEKVASPASPLMTEAEIAEVMAVYKTWNFPGNEDGWYRAHNAVRLDMSDLSDALATCIQKLEQGNDLPPWVVPNIQKWWPTFEGNVHHHHDIEETIVFPGIAKLGLVLPPKMSSDHATLLAELTSVADLVKGLKAGANVTEQLEAFTTLRTKYEAMRALMAEHLKEEEDQGLPLVRKTLTREQMMPVEKQVVAHISPELLGWFLRPFKDDVERRKWMSDIAGIPGFVQSLVMMPAAKKFRNTVARLILEVKEGERIVPEPTGCMCFGN